MLLELLRGQPALHESVQQAAGRHAETFRETKDRFQPWFASATLDAADRRRVKARPAAEVFLREAALRAEFAGEATAERYAHHRQMQSRQRESMCRRASDARTRSPSTSRTPRRPRCSREPWMAFSLTLCSSRSTSARDPPCGPVVAEELQDDDALCLKLAVGKLLGFAVHGKVRPFLATAPGCLRTAGAN